VIDLLRAKAKLLPDGGCAYFDGGGAGNSSNTSWQKTENADMRIVGGDKSVNTSNKASFGDNVSNVRISTTDFGAVSKSLDLALKGIEGAQKTTQQTIGAAMTTNANLLTSALHTVGEQQAGFTSALENTKTGTKTLLIGGGIAVLAIGAAMYFGRKG